MKIKDILAKIAKGEQLTETEKTTLETFDVDSMVERAKRAEQLEREAEDAANAKKSDLEKLQLLLEKERTKIAQLEANLGERESAIAAAKLETETARKQHAELLRKNAVSALAGKSGFREPEYLEYLAGKQGVDLTNETAAAAFIEDLKTKAPDKFEVKKAPGTPPVVPPVKKVDERPGDRVGGIIELLGNAPAIE